MTTALGWKEIANVEGQTPSARSGHTLVAHCEDHNKFILVGGLGGGRRNDVYVLTKPGLGGNGRWTWRAPVCKGEPPPPLCYHCAWSATVLVDRREWPTEDIGGPYPPPVVERRPYLFIYGGQNDQRYSLTQTFMLDLVTFVWHRLFISSTPPPRELAAYAYVDEGPGGSCYVFGGRTSPGEHPPLKDLWRLNLSACDWTLCADSERSVSLGGGVWEAKGLQSPHRPSGRHTTSMVTLGDSIYLFGGLCQESPEEGGHEYASDELWRFRIGTGRWELVLTMGQRPSARYGHACWVVGQNELAIWGGMGNDKRQVGDTTNIFVLDLDHLYWSIPYVDGKPFPSRTHAAISGFSDRTSVLWGGMPSGSLLRQQFEDEEKQRLGIRPQAPTGLWVVQAHGGGLPGHKKSLGGAAPATPFAVLGNESGVTMNMGPERALRDAESLLEDAKQQLLELETHKYEVEVSQAKAMEELRELKLGQEGRKRKVLQYGTETARLTLALSHERRLNGNLMKTVQVEHRLRTQASDLNQSYKTTLAAVEGLLMAEGLIVEGGLEEPASGQPGGEGGGAKGDAGKGKKGVGGTKGGSKGGGKGDGKGGKGDGKGGGMSAADMKRAEKVHTEACLALRTKLDSWEREHSEGRYLLEQLEQQHQVLRSARPATPENHGGGGEAEARGGGA